MSPAEEAIRHVLWHIGDRENGVEPGGFTSALLNAWGRADMQNSARLAAAFPALGRAVQTARFGGRKDLVRSLHLVREAQS